MPSFLHQVWGSELRFSCLQDVSVFLVLRERWRVRHHKTKKGNKVHRGTQKTTHRPRNPKGGGRKTCQLNQYLISKCYKAIVTKPAPHKDRLVQQNRRPINPRSCRHLLFWIGGRGDVLRFERGSLSRVSV